VGLDRLFQGSSGTQVNRMLDKLGLPDAFGDMIGAQIDAAKGDMAGYARNMMDLTSGLSTGQMDQMFGKGLLGPHFAPRPHAMMGKGRKLWGKQFHTPFGTHDISRERLGGKGRFGRMVGRSMEKAIMTNPAFKARMERVLGGRIIPDGRADGKITVHRFRPNVQGIPFGAQLAGNPMLSGIYGALSRIEGSVKKAVEQLTGAQSAKGGAEAGGTSGTDASNPYSAADDKGIQDMAKECGISQPMSFEDLLFLLMMKYAKKKEKEILDAANKITNKREDRGGYNAMDSKQSDTGDQAKLQKMMNDLQKVYQLLTNMIKSLHDMGMAATRNIR
jgi:hypothetical protein